MPKVVCTLENAADEISGIKFTALPEGGKVSEEISDDAAENLLSINGYKLFKDAQPPAPPVKPTKAPAPDQKASKKSAPTPAPAAPAPAPADDGGSADDGGADNGDKSSDSTGTVPPASGSGEETF